MKKFIITAAIVATAATLLLAALYHFTGARLLLSLAVTCGTFAYHFLMRLAVGCAVDGIMQNRANYHARWFHVHPFEDKIHRMLKVWKWKKYIPSYNPALFSMQKSPEEILGAMCQAEIVHEIIVPLSFLPILAAEWFGALPVFAVTSILAACVDLTFVLMQRYNRPRILKLMERLQSRNSKKE